MKELTERVLVSTLSCVSGMPGETVLRNVLEMDPQCYSPQPLQQDLKKLSPSHGHACMRTLSLTTSLINKLSQGLAGWSPAAGLPCQQ